MVRKSLAETLSAQAREFLEEGKPKPAARTALPDPTTKLSPLSGIDRVLAAAFWSDEDRVTIKRRLFERYRRQLEKAGHKVTSTGLVDTRANPNTRSLDKEVRELRREVAILADVTRTILQQVVDLGGKSPRDLRNLICGIRKKKVLAPAPEPGIEDDTAPAASEEREVVAQDAASNGSAHVTHDEAATGHDEAPEPVQEGGEAEPSSAPETPGAAGADVESTPPAEAETNGAASPEVREPTGAELEAESEGESETETEDVDEPGYVSRFRRPSSAVSSAGGLGSRLRRGPDSEAEAEAETEREEVAPPVVEKPRERVPRRDILAERGIREHRPEVKTKICPRCSREVSMLTPRCLSCGKQF